MRSLDKMIDLGKRIVYLSAYRVVFDSGNLALSHPPPKVLG